MPDDVFLRGLDLFGRIDNRRRSEFVHQPRPAAFVVLPAHAINIGHRTGRLGLLLDIGSYFTDIQPIIIQDLDLVLGKAVLTFLQGTGGTAACDQADQQRPEKMMETFLQIHGC